LDVGDALLSGPPGVGGGHLVGDLNAHDRPEVVNPLGFT
jgi:hypothetical protein